MSHILFGCVLLTGYGHSTPNTVGGKLFTMCYAIVGIPLGLVMFQSIGERLNKFSSVVIRNVKRMLHCKNEEASEINLIFVVTTLSSLTIAGGAAAFSRYEGWTYFDSVYYCFITLTTIGFGDMVALQKDKALERKPEYVAFALIFILFGLAIVAASLNLLVLRFVTMNTEDERRDEAEALQAAQGAVRLEGDVITANGSILSGQLGGGGDDSSSGGGDAASVCSCSCYPRAAAAQPRYTVRRAPGRIQHLLPLQPLALATGAVTRGDLPPLHPHRASI
ncbi:two pore potassium channel protein sup-9-like [Schistocerca nitens]|uniref:two pore potassium channel protein sup-9-like n=1 Tax=Schistocerca nitens TaxID=7011 RepID=UPI0021189522|nr:two pore potassium channel protein sup-9-like [Schistocerca nitens]